MKQICPEETCTGCFACASACHHDAISMKEDGLGALHPIVDENLCVNCDLCIRVCPNNTDMEFHYPLECYASWITDKEKRKICASGGIGTIMSEYAIGQGGVVFGSRYDENIEPTMAYTETAEGLEHFKGSRYVQSKVGSTTFNDVKKFLSAGRKVLFVGTPCQVAGLKTYLHRDYSSLVTVDLICHGVCPACYLKEETSFLSKKYGLKDIADIRFRGNDGNNFKMSLWDKERKELFPNDTSWEKLTKAKEGEQFYLAGFLMGVTLRENCYSCRYARPERISDITIGDFIGIGKVSPFNHPRENVSVVTANTQRGADFYAAVSKASQGLVNIKRDYRERLLYRPSLMEPFPRHKLNAVFRENYKRLGFAAGIRKTLKNKMRIRRLELILRMSLIPLVIIKHWLMRLKPKP